MTDTTPAVVDDETWSVTRTVRIDAPRSAVWAALTTPELISQWFGQRTEFDRIAVGGTGHFSFDGYGDNPAVIVEHQPESAFGYRWGTKDEPIRDDNSTLVRFTLDDEGDATLLAVVETGFGLLAGGDDHRRTHLHEHREGWDSELDELVALLAASPSRSA
ncbi:hypothetical protein GCM10027413_15690 [Conyzicola nivalis]|uniref:Activator of Hsp90 ATPase homologue 1/2-like C-terminal domain-containing protein n=1 Tax=Conyzicola nivalis TaxID=1477021 RepID=A0A916SFG4_9MICO|nr:SRPBCC domain-containing protein [Conyzicola nivalis]GGA98274.1 hypothetical protein GCM10010979_10930 [Conyzicola nivalis]